MPILTATRISKGLNQIFVLESLSISVCNVYNVRNVFNVNIFYVFNVFIKFDNIFEI